MSVDVASLDTALVNGSTVSDISPIETFSFEVELAPEVDAPLWVSYDNITVSTTDNIPLNLELSLQNPSPDESGTLVISGLLDGQSLNFGVQQGNDWVVGFANVADLELIGAELGDDFTLELAPYAELAGETEDGVTQTIDIEVTGGVSGFSISSFSATTSFSTFTFEESAVVSDGDNFVNTLLDDMSTQTQGVDA